MSQRVKLFGIEIDAVRMNEAVARVLSWKSNPTGSCQYVVTPNVDHTILLQENEGLREAYRNAGMILADGHPVVWASRLLRRPLPARVPGSDLVPSLFRSAKGYRALRVFLLGAAPGVAARAGENIERRWPSVKVVGTYSPAIGFENDEPENRRILDMVTEAQPDVLVVGLGAPKQELWVSKYQQQIQAPIALCVGATIDFLAGEKKRAPVWLRRIGMEWVHRMLSEPKRLVKRYLRDAWIFPQLVWRELRSTPTGT